MTSTENHPDEQAPRAPEGEAPHASSNEPTNNHAPAPVAPEPSHEAHAAPPAHEGADDGDDEGDDGDDAAAHDGSGAEKTAEAGAGQAGQPGQKKKRRRRRKKKTGDGASAGAAGAGGAPGAEGASADGAPAAEGEAQGEKRGDRDRRDRKKDRPREPRERPAFNFGDVVFGKITDITDDVLFVDLSGKARAVFDKRELDLPEDVEWGADPEEALDEEAAAAEQAAEGDKGEAKADEAKAAESPVTGINPPEGSATSPGETQAVAATTLAEDHGTAAPTAPDGAVVDTTVIEPPATASAHAAPAPKAEPIELPPVVLEVGANFVGIVHNDGGRGGLVVLTRHPKRVQRAKLIVAGAFKERGEVLGLVTGVIKGGVEVDVDGLRAFAPGSHMDLRLGADLHHLVGKRMLFVVTQYAKRGRDVVLSRKPFLEDEAKLLREAALSMLEIGSIVEGTVRSVVPFGAFVDVGGVEGLVPLSEMSHNRGDGPHDVFKVGEKSPVKILKVDEKGKIWLSRKAAIPDPWGEVAKKYAVGTKLTGKVARLQPFGAFIELEPGIDGLIHTADLSLKRIEHPSEVVKEGDPIDVVVVHLDIHAHKIGLHPAPTGDAANETPQRVIVHKPLKVAVVGYEPNGLIVRVLGATGRHARGWISAAATGTPRGTELRRAFPLNTQLDAKVMELDPKRGEVKLSIRALSEDTERSAYRQYREQVQRESKFGTFGDLLKKNLQK